MKKAPQKNELKCKTFKSKHNQEKTPKNENERIKVKDVEKHGTL
jgi:hypothetical protein